MTLAQRLPDTAVRDRIRTDTASTLFVEAGAGSGKTTSLVDRVTTLVLVDGVPLSRIAAVTFTERAGAELRDRLRVSLDQVIRDTGGGEDDEPRRRATDALADLDSAAIGTLHAFAQRVLSTYPIQAQLPPLIEVLDEVGSSVAFEARWTAMRRRLLDTPELADPLLLAMGVGVTQEHLRSLAKAFNNDWDLIEDRVLPYPPPPVTAMPPVDEFLRRAEELCARRSGCRADDDKFLPRLEALDTWRRTLQTATGDAERFATLVAAGQLKWGGGGKKANWPDLPGLKTDCQTLQADVATAVQDIAEAALRPLAHWIAVQVRAAALERARQGRLEFHDLLVITRDLLRRDGAVRAELQQAYPRLLLDEFQDTDPIQMELAVRIAAGQAGGTPDWRQVTVPPGSIFVVGDPKQSIYRFRRASIETYLSVQETLGESVALTTNFRTVAPILAWVNEVFTRVITEQRNAQPRYRALDPHRSDAGTGPAVVVLGGADHLDRPSADALRWREAADVADVIATALRDGWTVHATGDDADAGAWRPLRAGDIAVLVPSRTSLPFLEEALDATGVPFRSESSSLVYQAGEIRDLMAAARVLADPSDELSCVTALRSPLFGCGDDDLWTFRRDGGSFNILAPRETRPVGHPVSAAMDYLHHLHRRARWMTPSEVLTAVVTDRRMLETAATGPRARDQWRQIRFVVDQARAWADVETGGLRAYLAWAARQADETARVAESVLPETDLDVVRVMTVHAAKGLEFGMVVLSGMTSRPQQRRSVQLIWHDDGYAARLTGTMQTNEFQALQPLDEQMDDLERKRLLYVAATRARDHLVVSLHRSGDTRSNAFVLATAGAGDAADAVAWHPSTQAVAPAMPAARMPSPPAHAEWAVRVRAARTVSSAIPAQTASGLEGTEPDVVLRAVSDAGGQAKGARDLDLPPWSKGRYGSAVGRAVHAVLQTVDLVSGDGLASAATAQALLEGVTEHRDVVEALCRSALASDVVQRAAARRHWRESYVGTLLEDGRVLEGYVDLLYEEDDGSLVIVDYKTDAIPASALDARTAFYRPQLEAYHHAVSDAVGAERKVTPILLFLHPEAAGAARSLPS